MAGKAFIGDIRGRLKTEARSFAIKGTFLVHDKQVPLNKNGNPYLALVLKDRDGTINAKMWDNVEETERREGFAAGDFVKIDGEAQTYRGQPQLKIKKLSKVPSPGADALSDFLGSTSVSPMKMLNETRDLLGSIEHAALRGMLLARLDDPAFSELLARTPAAKTNHHAHLGGLLEHTLAICKLADALAGLYPRLDRDLLLAGAFLHDVGKMRELTSEAAFAYSDEGNLVGHLVIGAEMLTGWMGEVEGLSETMRLKLVHMVLAHHGQKEFGSPVLPKFPEALALHFLDNLDSKLQSMFEVADQEAGQRWSSYQAQFGGYLFLDDAPAEAAPADKAGAKRNSGDRDRQARETPLTHRPLAGLDAKLGDPDPQEARTGELFSAERQDGGDEK